MADFGVVRPPSQVSVFSTILLLEPNYFQTAVLAVYFLLWSPSVKVYFLLMAMKNLIGF